MIKGAGIVISKAISPTFTLSSDPQTRLVTSVFAAAALSTLILFCLSAIVDRIKTQGTLDKIDAVTVMAFAEWSQSAFEDTVDYKT